MRIRIKSRPGFFVPALVEDDDDDASISDDHRVAIEGWKARKEQLYKQQKSVLEANDDAEKVNLLSLSKKKSEE